MRILAARTVQSQGKSHHNLAHAEVPRQFPQAAHVFIPVDALHGVVGLRDSGFAVCESDSNLGSPVVQRQNLESALRPFRRQNSAFLWFSAHTSV